MSRALRPDSTRSVITPRGRGRRASLAPVMRVAACRRLPSPRGAGPAEFAAPARPSDRHREGGYVSSPGAARPFAVFSAASNSSGVVNHVTRMLAAIPLDQFNAPNATAVAIDR